MRISLAKHPNYSALQVAWIARLSTCPTNALGLDAVNDASALASVAGIGMLERSSAMNGAVLH